MLKIGDRIKLDDISPVYTITCIYYDRYGEPYVDGVGRCCGGFKGFRLKDLILVSRR